MSDPLEELLNAMKAVVDAASAADKRASLEALSQAWLNAPNGKLSDRAQALYETKTMHAA